MRKIRKTGFSKRQPGRLAARLTSEQSLTREAALEKVRRFLSPRAKKPDFAAARELVELFSLEAEELTEAGVPFEAVKALEARCVAMRLRH